MSVLDYLNEDCWRLVLDYVPVCDVIRTERVSRRWQGVVLRYLASIRIGIQHSGTYVFLRFGNVHRRNVEKVDFPSLELWSTKLGKSVVEAYCDSEQSLNTVGKHCPNVKAVTFCELPEHLISAFGTFKKFDEICFSKCDVRDDCVRIFLANTDVKKLQFWTNALVTGQCFSERSANLERLVLSDCSALSLHHLVTVDFRGLTELELHFPPEGITKNIRSLLCNMLNLVMLDVSDCEPTCEGFYEAVCELSYLEFLYAGYEVTNEVLIAITQSCRRMRALVLDSCCDVSRRGVAAACAQAGARLVCFGFASADVTDADVEAAVRACPNLAWLDVRWCERLTPALRARAAAARRDLRARRPLRILCSYTDLYGAQQEHKELILDEDAPCTEMMKFELSL